MHTFLFHIEVKKFQTCLPFNDKAQLPLIKPQTRETHYLSEFHVPACSKKKRPDAAKIKIRFALFIKSKSRRSNIIFNYKTKYFPQKLEQIKFPIYHAFP